MSKKTKGIKFSISIVDDEETIRDSLEIVLSPEYNLTCFKDAESFLATLDKIQPDLVLLDIGLPGISGIETLHEIKKSFPHLPVIMITAFEDVAMVIESMKAGAYDFMLKPINPDLLEITIEKALSSIALRKEVKILQEKYLRENLPCFIGESKKIEDIMDFIQLVAKSHDTPVMLTGETGTGKELIARAVHARSPVFQGPFVAVNCSAFPEDLIESELFGYEPGAFSGAKAEGKKGLIEIADKGTLFLDEVADLSPSGQAKLLRFLENGEYYKVGGTNLCSAKVRVVSATNKDIEALVKDEEFRKDLYFRLCVVKAQIPSLNERPDDILPLAKHFLYDFNKKFEKNIKNISQEAQGLLLAHEFTGNVRELKNIIERACLISKENALNIEDLGIRENAEFETVVIQDSVDIPDQGVDVVKLLAKIEKKYMDKALEITKGNETKAAKLLKMNHHTFRYRRKKL